MESTDGSGRLLAISDLHVGYAENRALVEKIRPTSDEDWLLVAGDVAETVADIRWTLELLAGRFRKVIWVPGNHELWTHQRDTITLRGVERYEHLVAMCREMGVTTPEDPYSVWAGPDGPAAIAPLFLLYDYSFLPDGCTTKEEDSRTRTAPGSCAPTSTCYTPIPIPAVRRGAGPEWLRPNAGWRRSPAISPWC